MTDNSEQTAGAPGREPSPVVRSRFAAVVPRTRAQIAIGMAALLFLAGSLGYLLGSGGSDVGGPDEGSADIGFLFDMSSHHEQAIQLSMIELTDGTEPSIQAFAREIIRSQSYEIGLMRMRLAVWGYEPFERPRTPMAWMGMSLSSASMMPGMADESELAALRAATGSDVDAMFVALMGDHHAGGVAMAQAAAESATDPWIKEIAAQMARIQASEVAELEYARIAVGLDAQPPGFVSDFGSDMDDMHDMAAESGDG